MAGDSQIRRGIFPWFGVFGAALGWALAGSLGCQLAYYFVDPEKQQEVKAEFGKIGDRKLAVVVWADPSTLDLYRRARHRVGKAVTYYMKKYLPEARFVPTEDVTRFQTRSGASWEGLSVKETCRRLDCDLILRVDLLEYTTRAVGSRELRKGRVRAALILYEGSEAGGQDAVFETDVVATYPPASVHGASDMDDGQILHETVEVFAQKVARKFYDHGVSMRGSRGR